jgi:DASH complex subunit DAM1
LRPSSRSSLREAHGYGHSISHTGYNQPAINALEPQFAELADSMADLEANFMHLQLMHESLTRFSESFASFLYGMNMNAFCVDFPEVCRLPNEDASDHVYTAMNTHYCQAPITDSFKRAKQAEAQKGSAPAPACTSMEADSLTTLPQRQKMNHPDRMMAR